MAEAYIKLFLDFPEKVTALNLEQRWELIMTMLKYCETRQVPDPAQLDPLVFAMFYSFKTQIDRDHENYVRISEQNRRNVMSRWSKDKPADTTIYGRIQSLPADTADTKNKESRMRNEESGKRNEERGMNTTTPLPPPTTDSSGGAGGGGFSPEILAYAREAARGADHPAAYERKILERIREAGFKTIEEVRAADEDRRKRQITPPGPVYADEDDFY